MRGGGCSVGDFRTDAKYSECKMRSKTSNKQGDLRMKGRYYEKGTRRETGLAEGCVVLPVSIKARSALNGDRDTVGRAELPSESLYLARRVRSMGTLALNITLLVP